MKTKVMEVDHLQENIAMFKNLPVEHKQLGLLVLHKVGHVLMYLHLKMRFRTVSIIDDDSIEMDLSYESLQDCNCQEWFILIALAGLIMEELVVGKDEFKTTTTEDDMDKVNLLIRIQNRTNQMIESEDDAISFIIFSNQVGTVLLKYQEEAGLLFRLLIRDKRLTYEDVILELRNKQELNPK